jgi:hypothetical protein
MYFSSSYFIQRGPTVYSTVYLTVYLQTFAVDATYWSHRTCEHFNRVRHRVRHRVPILIATIATVTIGVT